MASRELLDQTQWKVLAERILYYNVHTATPKETTTNVINGMVHFIQALPFSIGINIIIMALGPFVGSWLLFLISILYTVGRAP
jgi:MFS superfamily sulfate permease-like transporter